MNDESKSREHLLQEVQDLRRKLRGLEEQNLQYRQMEHSLSEMGTLVYRLKKAIETTGVGITITDPDGTIIYTNPADALMHGYTVDELLGSPSNIFTTPEYREAPKARVERHETFENWERERWNMHKDGTLFPVKLNSSPIYDSDRYYLGDVTVCEDISEQKRSEEELETYRGHLEELVEARTAVLRESIEASQKLTVTLQQEIAERKRAEEYITSSLQEKEVLLKEIHHRVKNNLQVIISLLSLQASRVENSAFRTIFRESERRVQAMALIHEKLYQSDTLSQIDFSEYITTLTQELYTLYHASSGKVRLKTHVDDVNLPLNAAIPCGLIINELVSNALKYAFPSRNGIITVTMASQDNGEYELVISDDGVGLPPGFRLENAATLGLQLVKGLSEDQLKGSLSVEPSPGTTWTIRFPA
ncbi:hypothetical protein CSB45_11930 [candidate division KSB3 bacterium]|uniref:Histidine kinase n=1 Tax=candidate division KSB3 bacterium TaxID=2044937 RepID=A0A2G6E2R8_9BACT|nr:MAG: hypothetical protein CSB45_11930 [candidate division KSB3 bacterium]PIE29236.1 MAG: hypothetical protein CSA57_09520 [candidate division KSB3 bacterium]